MSFTQAFHDGVDVLAVDPPVRNVIHESLDQMNAQAADRPALDFTGGIGRRARERIERNTIVPHDCAEMALVGRNLDVDEMLAVTSKSIAYDVGEKFIESNGNRPANLRRDGETATELVQRAQAPIDLSEIVLQPQLDTGRLTLGPVGFAPAEGQEGQR